MRCGIGIFAKTIGFSTVKSRLAKNIGTDLAEDFYRLSVDCVEAFVSDAGEAFPEQINPVWAVAEEEAIEEWRQRPFPAIWTGPGDLGQRMARVGEELFSMHGAFMLIGTDSPQLAPTVIMEALSMLAGGPDDVVIGPAADGGFYLFASRIPIGRDIWERVQYSQSDTLKQLKQHLNGNGISVRQLAIEQDVDELPDLRTLANTLEANHVKLNHQQQNLLTWIKQSGLL